MIRVRQIGILQVIASGCLKDLGTILNWSRIIGPVRDWLMSVWLHKEMGGRFKGLDCKRVGDTGIRGIHWPVSCIIQILRG